MKRYIPEIIANVKYLGIAILITMLFCLMLPVSYTLFHAKVYNIMQDKRLNSIKIETIKIKEKDEEIKKVVKPEKTKLTSPMSKTLERFNMDLSVLSGQADSGGVIAGTGLGNVIEEGEADVPPIKRIFIPPQYPARAREEGIEGKVTAKLLIDENGEVITVRIINEPRYWGFGSAVIEAAQKWKFEPAKLNNLPVKVWATQVIEFKL